MQIRMIDDFSYDLVPGLSRRTLHKGLVLNEPVDVAGAAIDAGKAERWPPVSAASEPPLVLGDPVETGGDDDPGAGGTPARAEPLPTPPAPKASTAPKRGAPKVPPAGSDATPAEAVEPGADDDAGDEPAGDAPEA